MVMVESARAVKLGFGMSAGTARGGRLGRKREALMFLHPKLVAATNRYVENGPEDRAPSFKHDFAGRVDLGGGILRYSTTSKAPENAPQKGNAALAMARIAAVRN